MTPQSRRRSRRARGHASSRREAALAALSSLEGITREYGPGRAARKLALIARLERLELPTAGAVLRLHEVLVFLLAYPDDLRVRRRTLRALRGFERREDLRRFAGRLADTGIAGTPIAFRFFARMAGWLASRWPERLAIDWRAFDGEALLETLLPLIAHPAEAPGLDEIDLGLRGWLTRMKGRRESDAAFLIRRMARLPAGPTLRDALYDQLDTPMVLAWGPSGPSRTGAFVPARRVHVQRRPLARERPDLVLESRLAPLAVRGVSGREAGRLIDLAREAMVTRQRDLDAFVNADPRDVRMVEYPDGLVFACLGVRPEDRLLLESVYGFLTLKNGVPIGYVLLSALYGSCEVAYNVFDSFRGAEAARDYARVIALARRLFGADAFTIVPYQLGDENEEAIESGAWWFYYKLGFRPRNPAIRRLAARELARMERSPGHRSSPATLRRLARDNVFLFLGREREDVLGALPLAHVGIAVTDRLARRYGSDRERGGRELAEEARRRLGGRANAGFTPSERAAWERWAPLVTILPGLDRWSAEERRALVEVVRSKGGRRESEFVRRFDAHPRLRRAVAALARRTSPD